MRLRKFKQFMIGLASAAIPLVTEATCLPNGAFSFFRDDDDPDYYYGYDDYYYYDDCGFYDDCYYDEVIYIEEY